MKAGQSAAAERIWQRYLARLVEVAHERLAGSPQEIADSEDVVVVAFETFLRRVRQGRFPRLDDRHDLWGVLLKITEDVAIDQRRRMSAVKRGEDITWSLACQPQGAHDSDSEWQAVAPEPTPDFAVAAAEQCRRLLSLLDSDELRRIAIAKVYGFENREIAQQEGLGLRSVERKLQIIRGTWLRELGDA